MGLYSQATRNVTICKVERGMLKVDLIPGRGVKDGYVVTTCCGNG